MPSLRKIIADFVAERDWSQFHSPKNVSMALAIEAAELMEHFQWLTTDASRELANDPEKLAEVGEELADVIGYSFALANGAYRASGCVKMPKCPAATSIGKNERPKKSSRAGTKVITRLVQAETRKMSRLVL